MKRRHLFALGAIGALAALVIRAPAAWLGPLLPAPLRLDFASGTIWSGRAYIGLGDTRCPVSWQVRGRFNDWAQLAITLAPPCEGASLLTLDPNRPQARDTHLALDAAVVSRLVPALASWQPGGKFELRADSLDLSNPPRGALTLRWNDARLGALPVTSRLGSYRANATLEGTTLRGRLQTLSGPLMLEGDFTLGTPPRADLLASAPDPQIEGWLKTLGIAEGERRYRLRMP